MQPQSFVIAIHSQRWYCGSKNLFPVQIENTLTAHDAIREAAAIAVSDKKYGEVVGTWIVREPDEVPLSRREVRALVAKNMNPQVWRCYLWGSASC